MSVLVEDDLDQIMDQIYSSNAEMPILGTRYSITNIITELVEACQQIYTHNNNAIVS